MLHAVWIENGQARYRNRWVRTQSLAAEEKAGRALFGGLLTPAFVDQAAASTSSSADHWHPKLF